MNNERGKFVVLYGANNLGKSEQAHRLVNTLNSIGIEAEYLKYPIYDLEPTGPELNKILRKGNPENHSAEETQSIFAQNRRDYEPALVDVLNGGRWIVAEDYTGTGIAWGLTFGVSLERLLELNKGLLREDLAICLDGERFSAGIERNHLHESSDKWELNRSIHRELSQRFNWEVVGANNSKEAVAEEIFRMVVNRFRV